MTYRETLARLGELAANVIEGERTIGIPTTWFDFYYRLTNEMTIDPSDGALIIECSPAVILALVKLVEELEAENARLASEDEVIQGQCSRALKQVEEMRKALDIIAGCACANTCAPCAPPFKCTTCIAREALAALDKEVE